jgi:hypothetical protein
LEDHIPELRGDARIVELLGASVEGNVETLLHALRYDIPVERVEPPTAALEYARRLAQHGVPVNALVRAYRLGQRQVNEIVFAEVRAIDIPESVRYTVIEAITRTLFEYIDWISQQVVTVYEDERERWLENQNSLRAVRVREVLAANKAVDADASSTSIRYPLRWHHLAVIMWCPDGLSGNSRRPQGPMRTRCSSRPTGCADTDGCRSVRNRPTPWPECAPTPRSRGTARIWRSGRWRPASRGSAGRTAKHRARAPSRWRAVSTNAW